MKIQSKNHISFRFFSSLDRHYQDVFVKRTRLALRNYEK